MVGDWLAWEPCSVSCGSGTAERKRSVKQQPACWGGWSRVFIVADKSRKQQQASVVKSEVFQSII